MVADSLAAARPDSEASGPTERTIVQAADSVAAIGTMVSCLFPAISEFTRSASLVVDCFVNTDFYPAEPAAQSTALAG